MSVEGNRAFSTHKEPGKQTKQMKEKQKSFRINEKIS
jgi:hypothetical protein